MTRRVLKYMRYRAALSPGIGLIRRESLCIVQAGAEQRIQSVKGAR